MEIYLRQSFPCQALGSPFFPNKSWGNGIRRTASTFHARQGWPFVH